MSAVPPSLSSAPQPAADNGIAVQDPAQPSYAAVTDALQATQEQMRAIYHALPDPAGITRVADGKYLEVNPAFCRMLQLPRDEIIGHTSTELGVWASPQERVRLIETLQRDGKVDHLPMVALGATGEVPGHMSARPVQIDGEACLIFVFHDTTQEQRTHGDLLAKNAALAQAGRMARLGAWEDVRGKGLVYWSDVCYDIHGLPRDAPLPRNYIETYVAPPWREPMREKFRQCIEQHTEWSMDVQIVRADGRCIWCRWRGEPVEENGRVMRIVGVMQDIDDTKRAEERLRQSEERSLCPTPWA